MPGLARGVNGSRQLVWRAILHVVYDNEHKDKVQLLKDTRNTYKKKELRRVNDSQSHG